MSGKGQVISGFAFDFSWRAFLIVIITFCIILPIAAWQGAERFSKLLNLHFDPPGFVGTFVGTLILFLAILIIFIVPIIAFIWTNKSYNILLPISQNSPLDKLSIHRQKIFTIFAFYWRFMIIFISLNIIVNYVVGLSLNLLGRDAIPKIIFLILPWALKFLICYITARIILSFSIFNLKEKSLSIIEI
ncbi:MAG: hypothetical protein U1E36_06685 [Rickettsiales bacterium]